MDLLNLKYLFDKNYENDDLIENLLSGLQVSKSKFG